MENSVKIWSIQHLQMLERSNPYGYGSFVYNSSGEIFTTYEVIDIWEELQEGELFYGMNWESELWSESGERIPAVYVEH
jgi:hypothetical protein